MSSPDKQLMKGKRSGYQIIKTLTNDFTLRVQLEGGGSFDMPGYKTLDAAIAGMMCDINPEVREYDAKGQPK